MLVNGVNSMEVNVFSKLEGMWASFNKTSEEVSAICSVVNYARHAQRHKW